MEIVIAIILVVVLLTCVVLAILFHIGAINCYHPMKKTLENQIKVACVGDSITYGFMTGNRNANNYPTVLNGLLGEGFCVNNFSYTNRTVIKDADFPLVKEKVYKQSLDFNPDIVFILLGSNDSKTNNWNKDKFIADYCEIIDSYLSLEAKSKVYLILPPPVFEVRGKVPYKLRKFVVQNEICPAIKHVAKEKGLEYIDIYSVFDGRRELFVDGVHPNAKGSKLLAESVFEFMRQNDCSEN